jgi:hypothetical protein
VEAENGKDDKLVLVPCRLEQDQFAFIEDLKNRRILGRNRNAVIRALINYAMVDMAKTGFLQQYRAMRDEARKL